MNSFYTDMKVTNEEYISHTWRDSQIRDYLSREDAVNLQNDMIMMNNIMNAFSDLNRTEDDQDTEKVT